MSFSHSTLTFLKLIAHTSGRHDIPLDGYSMHGYSKHGPAYPGCAHLVGSSSPGCQCWYEVCEYDGLYTVREEAMGTKEGGSFGEGPCG